MDGYFAEKTIRIESEGEDDPVTLVMRPLKVKEIPLLLRLEAVANRDVSDLSSFADFIDLVDGTVDGDITVLPREALDGIIKTFDELNFPERMKRKPATPAKEKFDEKEFARMVEYLVAQGHAFSEIEEYTLPRFRLFVELAIERLSGKPKKRVEPLEALRGLGIPVK